MLYQFFSTEFKKIKKRKEENVEREKKKIYVDFYIHILTRYFKPSSNLIISHFIVLL